MVFQRDLLFVVITCFIMLLCGCEKDQNPEYLKDLRPDVVRNTEWLCVNEKGDPDTKSHQKCTLIFLNENEYEVRKTFQYSGSTFRSPGIYEVKDSIIHLKSFNGQKHLGNVSISNNTQLKVQWFDAKVSYGKGVEFFEAIDSEM